VLRGTAVMGGANLSRKSEFICIVAFVRGSIVLGASRVEGS